MLTHFSSRYQFSHDTAPLIDDIAVEAKAFYNGKLFLAKDFADYRLNRNMTLDVIN